MATSYFTKTVYHSVELKSTAMPDYLEDLSTVLETSRGLMKGMKMLQRMY
jgi:hypothetical protein